MTETKVTDKRGAEKPDRPKIVVYPTCRTCKYFEQFVNADGRTGSYICVYDPPHVQSQIQGVEKVQTDTGDYVDQVLWATWNGWPATAPHLRCGKHSARDAN